MPKYIAFLRAINVGGRTVKMDQLRGLFEELGFSNVETFIASGNVIFDSNSRNPQTLERTIEQHLHLSLGYEVTTFLRSPSELAAIASFKPFDDLELETEGNVLYVAFIANNADEYAAQELSSRRSEVDDFYVKGREVYWLHRRFAAKSAFQGPPLEKCLGTQATVRNINTVRRLAGKYS